MRFTRLGWIPVFGASVVLSACATPAPDPLPTPTVAAISLQDSCHELSDVQTLISNLRLTHDDGRLSDLEWQGALQLAARMVARIDVEPDSALEPKLRALQELAEPSASGALAIVHPESLEWNEALQAAGALCGEDFGSYSWRG
jgi:hypothetical protein